MRTLTWIAAAALACVAATAVAKPEAKKTNPVAVIETNLGTIEFELFPDNAPKSVENFIKLAKSGFYNGVLFHRVVAGFVIQGGDPNTKDPKKRAEWGEGGPGYSFADEKPWGDYERGMVAMANSGPNTNGSQFFICTKDLRGRLPHKYNLFGKVVKGLDVVEKIEASKVDGADCPLQPVVMKKVSIRP